MLSRDPLAAALEPAECSDDRDWDKPTAGAAQPEGSVQQLSAGQPGRPDGSPDGASLAAPTSATAAVSLSQAALQPGSPAASGPGPNSHQLAGSSASQIQGSPASSGSGCGSQQIEVQGTILSIAAPLQRPERESSPETPAPTAGDGDMALAPDDSQQSPFGRVGRPQKPGAKRKRFTGTVRQTYVGGISRFRSQFCYNGQCYQLGTYETEVEAAQMWDRVAWVYRGTSALLNFPELVDEYDSQASRQTVHELIADRITRDAAASAAIAAAQDVPALPDNPPLAHGPSANLHGLADAAVLAWSEHLALDGDSGDGAASIVQAEPAAGGRGQRKRRRSRLLCEEEFEYGPTGRVTPKIAPKIQLRDDRISGAAEEWDGDGTQQDQRDEWEETGSDMSYAEGIARRIKTAKAAEADSGREKPLAVTRKKTACVISLPSGTLAQMVAQLAALAPPLPWLSEEDLHPPRKRRPAVKLKSNGMQRPGGKAEAQQPRAVAAHSNRQTGGVRATEMGQVGSQRSASKQAGVQFVAGRGGQNGGQHGGQRSDGGTAGGRMVGQRPSGGQAGGQAGMQASAGARPVQPSAKRLAPPRPWMPTQPQATVFSAGAAPYSSRDGARRNA